MSQKYVYDEKTNSYIPVDDDKVENHGDEKLIAILIWAANFVLPLIAGIVAYIYYENKNEFLKNTAKESLNYGISLLIYSLAGSIIIFATLLFASILLYPALACYYIVIPIIGMLKASEMEVYKPHFTIRFIQ